GADDPAARVLRDELRDQLAQLGALIPILDLARDADLGRERHVDQEAAGERNLRGDARSLGPDRLFDDLNELRFAALQLVADVGQAASGGAPPSTPAPTPVAVAVVLVVVIGGLVVLLRLDQVGGVEKGALFGSDVDEGGLDSREHGLDRAQVDIAHHAAGVRTIHQELNKAVVLQDRHASLARGPADEYFSFQSRCPRPRSANSR